MRARIMSGRRPRPSATATEEPRIIRQFKQEPWSSRAARRSNTTRPMLFAPGTHQSLAEGLEIGRRFHSAPVVRLSDARQMQLGHVAQADAAWRIYAFAARANRSDRFQRSTGLRPGWRPTPVPVVRHTRKGEDVDAVIDPVRVPADLRQACLRAHAFRC